MIPKELEKAKLTELITSKIWALSCTKATGERMVFHESQFEGQTLIDKEPYRNLAREIIPIIEEWVRRAAQDKIQKDMCGFVVTAESDKPFRKLIINYFSGMWPALKQSKEIPCPDCDGGKKSYWNIDGKHKYDCPTCKGTGNIIEQSKEEWG